MIKLGQKARCKVTGFTGIAVAKCEYLNGCIQFCLKPKMKAKDNKDPEGVYIDEGQLEVVGQGILQNKKKAKEGTGGIMSDTPSSCYSG